MSLRNANVDLRSKLTICFHAVATHREVESAQAPEQIAALRQEADMSMYLDWNITFRYHGLEALFLTVDLIDFTLGEAPCDKAERSKEASAPAHKGKEKHDFASYPPSG
ncbi:hypothetical protein FPHYL_13395 [Fusarium phyllophilum]|uniref:Uncharacterized protein n=1 Tax=Fusarium phyllophilum TaxID=47803 RepID=A0A8H5ID49_9HYPO|nr:hypothetical protein FPHYL_13395 [Fusarium phyllophilum]